MTRISLLVLLVALAAVPSPARAATLFTGALAVNSNVNNFDINQLDIDIMFLDNELTPTNLVSLFDGLVISPSNVGDTFEATAANDPLFSTAVDRLTDGSNEFIHVMLTENEVGGLFEERGGSESNFFASGSPPLAPNPVEVTIDSIAIRIDKFILLPTGQSGMDLPLDLELTFTINGTLIPEPSTDWLFAAGLATLVPLLFFQRRRPVLVKARAPRREE